MMESVRKKIMVWGDSIFKGVGQDETGRYRVMPDNCGALFTQSHPVELVNRARFGCTAPKGMHIMESDLQRGVDAQYAVIEFGGNDCDFDWAAVAADPDGEHEAHTPLPEFVRKIGEMVDAVRAHGMTPILVTMPPIEPNRFFATISRGLNAENLLRWLGSAFTTYRWQERYSDAIADAARAKSVPLLDIRSAFLTEHHYEDYICADGMHPNEKGHRLIARELEAFAAQMAG